jgi:hypothetical protein
MTEAAFWRFTPYSVTVRYKQREVSLSCSGSSQKDVAIGLLTELIEHDALLSGLHVEE